MIAENAAVPSPLFRFGASLVLGVIALGSSLARAVFLSGQEAESTVHHLDTTINQLSKINQDLQQYARTIDEEAISRERNRISREIHDISGYRFTNVIALMDAAISIISATIVYFAVPETKPALRAHEEPESFGKTLTGYGSVLRHRLFVFFIFACLLSGLVYMNMNTTLGVFLRDNYGIPEDGYAYILSVNAAMVVLFQFWITRRIEKLPPMLVMAAGTTFYAIGFAMYGFVGNYGMFILAMVVITIGEMLVAPVGQALVASFAPEQMRGRYNAVFGILAWGTPFAIGPLLAGQIIDGPNPNWLWYACGFVGTLSVLSYLVLHRFHHPAVEAEGQPAEASSPA